MKPFILTMFLFAILNTGCRVDSESIDCVECPTPTFIFANNITNNSALIGWERPRDLDCGYYIVSYGEVGSTNLSTSNTSDNHILLQNLVPCTSYWVEVSYVSNYCVSSPVSTTFQTLCDYCTAYGVDPVVNSINLGFGVPGYFFWDDNDFLDYSQNGYSFIQNPHLNLVPGLSFSSVINIGAPNQVPNVDGQVKVWLDYNANYVFESSELIFDDDLYQIPVTLQPQSNIAPDSTICSIRGRIIISPFNEISNPCEGPSNGRVVDFIVDNGNCSHED